MTTTIDAGPRGATAGSAPRPFSASRIGTVTMWLTLAALLAIAIWLRHVVAANTDVSWLITVGERVLDGQRLYVDVIETNPPIAVLIYMPGIVLARLLHLPAEMVIDALVFVAIAASLGICVRCLKPSAARETLNGGWSIAVVFVVLAIVPTQAFGQREHIALIALLPSLAVMVRRLRHETPSLSSIMAAGAGMALALCFKPFFAIGILSGIAATAIALRSWRIVLAPEHIIAALLAGLYVVAIAVLYPEFLTVIGPLARDVYLPVGIPLSDLLAKPATMIWLTAAIAALVLGRRTAAGATVHLLLAVSCGFALVFVIQRKGWPYHSYPAVALALIALGVAMSSLSPAETYFRVRRGAAIAVFAAVVAASMLWFDVAFDARPLQASVAQLGSHANMRPRILAITAEPGLGHPLVRALDGVWVSRQQGIWVAAYIDYMRKHGQIDQAQASQLAHYAARERARLAEDIRKSPPTVVLVDNLTGDWRAWLADHQEIADLLKDYRTVDTVNKIELRVRPD